MNTNDSFTSISLQCRFFTALSERNDFLLILSLSFSLQKMYVNSRAESVTTERSTWTRSGTSCMWEQCKCHFIDIVASCAFYSYFPLWFSAFVAAAVAEKGFVPPSVLSSARQKRMRNSRRSARRNKFRLMRIISMIPKKVAFSLLLFLVPFFNAEDWIYFSLHCFPFVRSETITLSTK